MNKEQQFFDLIFYQAGVDILNVDRLGKFQLTLDGIQRRDQLIYQFASDMNVPLVITMGGGYPKSNNDWEATISAHTNVYVQAFLFQNKRFLYQLDQQQHNT